MRMAITGFHVGSEIRSEGSIRGRLSISVRVRNWPGCCCIVLGGEMKSVFVLVLTLVILVPVRSGPHTGFGSCLQRGWQRENGRLRVSTLDTL